MNPVRIVMACLAAAVLTALAPLSAPAADKTEELRVLYLERPPYYWTENGRPTGFLMNLTRRILDEAGVEATYVTVPAARIIAEIHANRQPLCSLGWFRTSQRETFASFSLPIYRDNPLVLLTARDKAGLFKKHTTLRDVFEDTNLIMAQVASFSYGEALDRMLRDIRVRNLTVSTSQAILPKLILHGRATYMLAAPEEVQTLLRSAGVDPERFVSLKMDDIPAGNLRHFMFSKSVPENVIRRINQAIESLTDQEAILHPAPY